MDCRLWSNSGQMSLFSSLRNAGFHLCFQEVGRHSSVTLPGSPGQPNQPGFEPLQGKNYPLLSSPQLHSLLQQSSQCALLYFSVCPTSGPRAMPRRRAQPRAPCLHPPAPAALQPHEQRRAAPRAPSTAGKGMEGGGKMAAAPRRRPGVSAPAPGPGVA